MKNNLCKVSRRRARDRNPSRRDLRDWDWDSKKWIWRRVSRPRPRLETPSLVINNGVFHHMMYWAK